MGNVGYEQELYQVSDAKIPALISSRIPLRVGMVAGVTLTGVCLWWGWESTSGWWGALS